jgi:hypothetical protein
MSSDISINDQLVLISGESATGKSASLMNIPNQERWIYLNCEAGKRLPFRNRFKSHTVTDPYQVYEAFEHVQENPDFDGVIIDTLTFLMDMQESVHVIGANDTQAAWGEYGQFFKRFMQQYVASSDKAVLVLAHTKSVYNDKTLSYEVSVPVKGALKNNGVEAYFSTVVSTKKVNLPALAGQDPSLLHVTPEDEALGYKHVFQTRLTKETIGERIRSPMGMFAPNQTYIDNDAYALLRHLHTFYA